MYDAYGEDGLKGGGPGDGPSASGFQGFRARDAEEIFAEVCNCRRSCIFCTGTLISNVLIVAIKCSSLAIVAPLPSFQAALDHKCFSALREVAQK
jgi:hypothetical protein